MTVTLESTSRLVEVDGVPARVWEGKTATGIPVIALITRVAVEKTEDTAQFEKELVETRAPSRAAVDDFPSRLVL